jgi:hypothetical protein
MTDAALAMEYKAALHFCQLEWGVPPRAALIQQFVAAWKELQRRRKVDPK